MITINDCDVNIPVNESLYTDKLEEKTFIGFPIKNNYDHSRFIIPERYKPQRITYNGLHFYGIWVETNVQPNCDDVITLKRFNDKIFGIPFGDGEKYLDIKYKNFDSTVYKESPVPFYHKLAQMYIYVFLP